MKDCLPASAQACHLEWDFPSMQSMASQACLCPLQPQTPPFSPSPALDMWLVSLWAGEALTKPPPCSGLPQPLFLHPASSVECWPLKVPWAPFPSQAAGPAALGPPSPQVIDQGCPLPGGCCVPGSSASWASDSPPALWSGYRAPAAQAASQEGPPGARVPAWALSPRPRWQLTCSVLEGQAEAGERIAAWKMRACLIETRAVSTWTRQWQERGEGLRE